MANRPPGDLTPWAWATVAGLVVRHVLFGPALYVSHLAARAGGFELLSTIVATVAEARLPPRA